MPENAPSQGVRPIGSLAEWHLGVGHGVDRGEEVVHERVIGIEEVAEVQVVPCEMAKKPQGLLRHALGDGLAVVAESIPILDRAAQAVEPHPLREESVHRVLRFGTFEHAPCNCLDLLSAFEIAGRCGIEQIRVR